MHRQCTGNAQHGVHYADGQMGSLASCTSQLRGQMKHPMFARITYDKQKLQLEMGTPSNVPPVHPTR